ncbi:MAG: glutamine--fructose-6-phosphate transaminase (isomerizing) [Candidatus Gracilibacteria bacterium]|nr:glutamine--fructose-6-phosphate transaminase (isomerizing) [Candidatus Gracilibacteria bacterium]
MCGIFAYLGPRNDAGRVVIDGLKRLEYRGYDSWGIALQTGEDRLWLKKEVGKISAVENLELPNAQIAIGHSRWATHGGVTQKNAHPHLNEKGTLAVVHNGIIENFQELRKELKKKHKFRSETDSEIITHLLEDFLEAGKSLEEAARLASFRLQGRFAFVVISNSERKLVAARRGSPLIIGVGEGEYFLASDIPAFLPYTRHVNYLDDDQMVVISMDKLIPDALFLTLEDASPISKRSIEIDWDAKGAEKGDYPHFMLKEIMEQKETICRAANQDDALIHEVVDLIKKSKGTFLLGCGTAGKVALTGSYLFSRIAKEHINAVFGSEFPAQAHFINDKTLIIAISQSGETADTMEALELAQAKGAKIVSIVNVEGSSMDRMSDITINIKAGPEKAVASTKATTAQIAVLTLLAYAMVGRLNEAKQLLVDAASQITEMLNPRYDGYIETLAVKLKDFESMYVIGRGLNYPMALEAAIKLQEVSYIHAEGFAGGELKHGPIALITQGTPLIALVSKDESEPEILSNAIEVKARGGYVVGVSPENNDIFDYWIKVPDVGNAAPILSIIPIQILAYKLAVLRGNDPDMPRNLAKSVTVK